MMYLVLTAKRDNPLTSHIFLGPSTQTPDKRAELFSLLSTQDLDCDSVTRLFLCVNAIYTSDDDHARVLSDTLTNPEKQIVRELHDMDKFIQFKYSDVTTGSFEQRKRLFHGVRLFRAEILPELFPHCIHAEDPLFDDFRRSYISLFISSCEKDFLNRFIETARTDSLPDELRYWRELSTNCYPLHSEYDLED